VNPMIVVPVRTDVEIALSVVMALSTMTAVPLTVWVTVSVKRIVEMDNSFKVSVAGVYSISKAVVRVIRKSKEKLMSLSVLVPRVK